MSGTDDGRDSRRGTDGTKEPEDTSISDLGGLVFRASWVLGVVLVFAGMYTTFGAFGATPLSGGDVFASLPDFLGPTFVIVGLALFPIGVKLGAYL